MNFLSSYYHHSAGPGASFVKTGDFTILDPLNSSIDASNWNLVQEQSYHITLAVNVNTLQDIPGRYACPMSMTECSSEYVFFISPHFSSSF